MQRISGMNDVGIRLGGLCLGAFSAAAAVRLPLPKIDETFPASVSFTQTTLDRIAAMDKAAGKPLRNSRIWAIAKPETAR